MIYKKQTPAQAESTPVNDEKSTIIGHFDHASSKYETDTSKILPTNIENSAYPSYLKEETELWKDAASTA